RRLAARAMTRDQPQQGRLDVLAELAAFGSGPAKVAAQEAQGELLVQVVRGVSIPNGTMQVARDGPAIAVEKLLPRRFHACLRTGVGPADHRPASRNVAEVHWILLGQSDSSGAQVPPSRGGPPRPVNTQ